MTVILSAVDFLKLIDERQVARVDLSEVGRQGVAFVRDLNAGEKEELTPRPKGKVELKTRGRKGGTSYSLDWSQLPKGDIAKFLKACLVTDKTGGKDLEAMFTPDENGVIPKSVTVSQDVLIKVYDKLIEATGKTGPQAAIIVMGQLESFPNGVANLLMKRIREISGLDEDEDDEGEDEEKKG